MIMTRKNRQKDAAVSPVVGVLLMLVVTVIIAAVVSGFAGGLTRGADKTPQVALDVNFVRTAYGAEIVIKHLGGDPINTKTTEIITSWTNQTTGDVNYARTGPGPVDTTSCTLATCNAGSGNPYQEPYLVEPGVYVGSAHPELSYGNYILYSGQIAKAGMVGSNPNYSLVKNVDLIGSNDLLTFRLVDTISGGIIYEKNLRVQ